ncbi:MAG TPA: hypothetical protein VMW43_06125 [Bacteroidota bacterium]|nr:hypothetical protein [Bacteroidota bacterium]
MDTPDSPSRPGPAAAPFAGLAAALLLLLLAASCTPGAPAAAPKIDEARFAEYYAASMILTHQLKLQGLDSAGIAHGVDTLRRSYHLDQEDIQETLDYYHQHLPQWRDFNAKLISLLSERQKSVHRENLQRESRDTIRRTPNPPGTPVR